ncbi:MAG: prolipoprotein diacylglyceryl transferase [Myxococcota bacterium]
MFPTLFTFSQDHGLSMGLAHAGEAGVIGFHTWGLMVMLAFLAAFLLVSARAPKVGIEPDSLVPLYLIISIFGMAGARLLHFVFAEPDAFFANPLVFFDMGQGGFAFLGGVLGGVISGAVYAGVRKIPVLKLADVAAPAIMLALGIGRMGCFFAGCCHGQVCALPTDVPMTVRSVLLSLPGGSIVTVDGFPFLALVFERGVGVGAIFDVPLFPTQMWEIATGVTLFALLSWMWARARYFDGQILAAMMVLYAAARITIEGFRGDVVRGVDQFGSGLSTSQLVGVALVVTAAIIVAWRAPKGVAPEQEVVFDDDDDYDLAQG